MVEIEVRNFQSIEKAQFKIDGFTVVVGRSNIGKSALVRAVKAALTGAPVSSFVRHSRGCLRRTKKAKSCKCFASVHIKADGIDLLWEKGDAINRYTYNGQVYDKAERGTPDFLYPAFSPIKVGDRQDILQVADQFVPVFLLDQTGGTIADTLSDVAKLDRINVAMRLAERDRKEAVSTRRVRERDVVALQGKLQAYDGLDTALGQVQALERKQAAVERQERALVTLERFLEAGSALGQTIKALEAATEAEVPHFAPIVEHQDRLQQCALFDTQLTEREADVASLDGVDALAALDLTAVRQEVTSFQRLDGWLAQLVDFKRWLQPGADLEKIFLPTMGPLQDKVTAVGTMTQQLSRLVALEAEVSQLEVDLATVTTSLEQIHQEQDALGVCPMCVQPLRAPR